jgi:hypothetical protein
MPVDPYPAPPPLEEFSSFRIPDGREWVPSADWDTHDNGCVAIAAHPAGWVAVADTKNPATAPLVFNEKEWAAFTAFIRSGSE